MGDQTEFKHIKVSSDVDDEVIYVGAPSAQDSELNDSSFGATVMQEGPSDQTIHDAVSASQHDVSKSQYNASELQYDASKPHADTVLSNSNTSEKSNSEKPDSEKTDDYHATTLSDIEESKMPKTQVITIALALIAIAAFIIWYILAM